MINFFNSKNSIQKSKVMPKKSQFWKILNGNRKADNLQCAMPAIPMKVLSGQILAMAEQDNKAPTGKNLDIFT